MQIITGEENLIGLKFDNGGRGLYERDLLMGACAEYVIHLSTLSGGQVSRERQFIIDEIHQMGGLSDRLQDGIPEPEIEKIEQGEGFDDSPFGGLIPTPFGVKVGFGPEVENFFDPEEIELLETALMFYTSNTPEAIEKLSKIEDKGLSVIQRASRGYNSKVMLDKIRSSMDS